MSAREPAAVSPESSSVNLVVLTSHNAHHYALVRALARRFRVRAVFFEDVASKRPRLFKRRLQKLGLATVLNQLLFQIPDRLRFRRQARARLGEILGLETTWDPEAIGEAEVVETPSLNQPEVVARVAAAKPDVVVVSGTGILGKRLIQAVRPAPIVNIHCGITPRYRGTHGAFWAVVNGDWENIGTTVHYIDEGIDTGGILAQGTFVPEPRDDPRTLVLKQYRVGIELMLETVERLAAGQAETIERPDLDSRLYSSPTLTAHWTYRNQLRARQTTPETQERNGARPDGA